MDDLCFLTATEQSLLIRKGTLSARELVSAHIYRIQRVNPEINAIVTFTPDLALEAASEADDVFARGDLLGPLHGLPIAHKDLFRTAGVRTTYGSEVYAKFVPDEDDLIVQRTKAAGAISLGKTNTPEFGAGSHTFNVVFGATKNPYETTKSVGGSSGGAAAALAARLIPIADGNDLGASLRNPAAFCNVVGLRPSPGRVPTWPTFDVWDPMSVIGPMARTVRDAALLLSAIAGPDPRIPISLNEPGSAFDPARLEGPSTRLRIALAPDAAGTMPVVPRIASAVADAGRVLESLGHEVVPAFPDLTGARDTFVILRAHGFERDLGEILDQNPDVLKPVLAENIKAGRRLTNADIAYAERARSTIAENVSRFFEGFDALVMPTTQVLPFRLETEYPTEIDGVPMESYLDWMQSCWCITVTGLPAISVPGGFSSGGLPIGVQFVGRRWGDFELLRLALAFEEATGWWNRLPNFAAAPTGAVGDPRTTGMDTGEPPTEKS